MSEEKRRPGACLMVAIVDRGKGEKAALLCGGRRAPHTICPAQGTVNSEILDVLGLARTSKDLVLGLLPPGAAQGALLRLAQGMELTRPGRGIAFTLPLSGASSRAVRLAQEGDFETREEGSERPMGEQMHYDLILAIVNEGCVDLAVDAATAAGARGGTLLHGRGTGDAAGFLGVPLPPEREIVAILVPASLRHAVLASVNAAAGLSSEAQGLVFSLPVDEVAGLHPAAGGLD